MNLSEGRFDGYTRQLVKDVLGFIKNNNEGEFSLPEDFGGDELTYDFGNLEEFSVTLILEQDPEIEDYDVDGEYYRDDDTIVVRVSINPDINKRQILYDLVGDLNELIMHELIHVKQKSEGFDFPKKTPKTPYGYYSRDYEIEAQRKGFKRVSKIQKKEMGDVMKRWYDRNKPKHNLSQKDFDRVVKKILDKKP